MNDKNLYIIILLVSYIWIYNFPKNSCEDFSLSDADLEKLKLKFLNNIDKEEKKEDKDNKDGEEYTDIQILKNKLLKKINEPNHNKLSFYFLGTGLCILIMVICLCIRAHQDHSIKKNPEIDKTFSNKKD